MNYDININIFVDKLLELLINYENKYLILNIINLFGKFESLLRNYWYKDVYNFYLN